ncbi:MAG: NapC/NirT family cytochrome c [Thermoanaerobaculia bacterium]
MEVNHGLVAVVLATIALVGILAFRPSLTVPRRGKILAFLAFFILPIILMAVGTSDHLEHSKSTEFCLSCHVMEPYGESLYIDSGEYLPASHFQNNRIPSDKACFTCHTTYTMYGDLKAKIQGLRHVLVNYLGEIPDELELYLPYSNRECLHCHGSARSFLEGEFHIDMLAELESNELSCLECHEFVHDIAGLGEADLWKGGEE